MIADAPTKRADPFASALQMNLTAAKSRPQSWFHRRLLMGEGQPLPATVNPDTAGPHCWYCHACTGSLNRAFVD